MVFMLFGTINCLKWNVNLINEFLELILCSFGGNYIVGGMEVLSQKRVSVLI